MAEPIKAVILLSGGLDSTTCLAVAKQQGFDCYTLAIDYGQKHRAEIAAAEKIAHQSGVKAHETIQIELGKLSLSALTDTALSIPDHVDSQAIPITYVPARNTVFLSIALAWAESLTATAIFMGANRIDYSNYPDCRPEFIDAFTYLANVATRAGIEGEKFTIHAPLLHLTKAEIIQLGMSLGVDYSQTISCYRANPQGQACGTCDSCALRQKGFKEAGVVDSTIYSEDFVRI